MEQNDDINVDSLWMFPSRDKTGKHSNVYHGNFVPQIPNQLIRRYTKEREIVLDLFSGSGTTLFECEKLNRRFIGFDINEEIIAFTEQKMQFVAPTEYVLNNCDVGNAETFQMSMKKSFLRLGEPAESALVDFIIVHPPYLDIVKFTEKHEDLSQISDSEIFVKKFVDVMTNGLKYLRNGKYFSIVCGDVYKNKEVVPLGFYLMDAIKRSFSCKLKGIIVKNIEGNRGKLGVGSIWKARALRSDYFLFKHEYIFVFKKEFTK